MSSFEWSSDVWSSYLLTARVVLVESKLPSELEQLLVEQTSKVTLPVSCESWSRKVAVNVGVAVFRRAASGGRRQAGVDCDSFADVFVTDLLTSVAVAAALPVARAVSRTIGSLPGLV